MKAVDVKPKAYTMGKSEKAYDLGWGTYNEAGFTYNEAGYTYGGIYGTDKEGIKIYNKVEVVKPL